MDWLLRLTLDLLHCCGPLWWSRCLAEPSCQPWTWCAPLAWIARESTHSLGKFFICCCVKAVKWALPAAEGHLKYLGLFFTDLVKERKNLPVQLLGLWCPELPEVFWQRMSGPRLSPWAGSLDVFRYCGIFTYIFFFIFTFHIFLDKTWILPERDTNFWITVNPLFAKNSKNFSRKCLVHRWPWICLSFGNYSSRGHYPQLAQISTAMENET